MRLFAQPGRILASSGIWLRWVETALVAEAAAAEAREALMVAYLRHVGNPSDSLADESRAAIVATAASAHALDALYGAFVTDEIRAGFSDKTARSRKVRVCLGKAFVLPTPGRRGWPKDFVWLFDLRDSAVHSDARLEELRPHPFAMVGNVDHAVATYTHESARRAVDLLVEVLEGALARPRSSRLDAVSWAAGARASIEPLIAQRVRRAVGWDQEWARVEAGISPAH